MLYELLTGQLPFDGESPVSIALKQSRAPGPALQLRPGISPAVEAVVMRALEKDPARRYESAEEFIAALEQARRQPTRQIQMDQTPGRAVGRGRAPGRSRWWLWLLAVLVCPRGPRRVPPDRGPEGHVPNRVGGDAEEAAAT